jgi:hypothetical protein
MVESKSDLMKIVNKLEETIIGIKEEFWIKIFAKKRANIPYSEEEMERDFYTKGDYKEIARRFYKLRENGIFKGYLKN